MAQRTKQLLQTQPIERKPPSNPFFLHRTAHFVGKHGEKFDFNGEPGQSYCLIADKKIHINMHVFGGRREGTTVSTYPLLKPVARTCTGSRYGRT